MELRDYINLCKVRISLMVVLTASLGFLLAGGFKHSPLLFIITMVGTFLSSSGSAVLNNYLERDVDKLMERTRNRTLPSGRVPEHHALYFGVILVLVGVTLLAWQVNLLTGFLALLTSFLYVLVYTPLKRITWLNTSIGAIPGAIPPMGGWTAATGELEAGAWILFFLMFFWQHPHFFAIAWLYKDDYDTAGYKMLPSLDPTGERTSQQILSFSVGLALIALLPYFYSICGLLYLFGSAILGFYILYYGGKFAGERGRGAAKSLLIASIIYLPGIFGLVLMDRVLF